MIDLTKFTKPPWRFIMHGSEGGRLYPDEGCLRTKGAYIAVVNGRSFEEDQANGHLIMQAVNKHQERIDALEHCLKIFRSMSDRGRYPLELLPGPYFDEHGGPHENPYFLGKQGFRFALEALEPYKGGFR